MKLNELKVDAERESNGDWVESPTWPGVRVHVRSIHNPDYRRALQLQVQKIRRKYGNEPTPPEVQDKMMADLFVEHIINDIQGLEDDNDKPIQYDKDFGRKVMSDPEYRRLADFVSWAAGVVGEDETEELEADVGNSKSGSGGKRTGGST